MNRYARRTVFIASAGLLACGAPSYVIVHNPVVTVRITPALDTIPFGGSVALTIATFDVNGDPTTPDHPPVWTSLNTAVFNVDSVGDVSSHWFGTGTIRAVVEGVEGDAVLVALPPPVTALSLTTPVPRIERGDSVRFQLTATNGVQLAVPTTGARWTVSDSTILRVDSTGRGMGVGTGVAKVRASFAGLTDSVTEIVLVPAASVALAPDSLGLAFGALDSFRIAVRDSAGNLLTDRPVSVVASAGIQAPLFLAPPAAYLPVRGVASGTTRVSVLVGHVRDSATVIVGPQHFLSFASAALGGAFTCGVTVDSAAYCWGWGHEGELGTGDTLGGPQPRPVAGGLKFASLTAGPDFACGLTGAGTAYCWGGNTAQQLGTGGAGTPVPVAVGGGNQFTALDAHFSHLGDSTAGGVCGLAIGGQVYCWGSGWGATPVAVGSPGFVDRLALGALGYCGVRTSDSAAFCWSATAAPARLAGWDTLPLALESRGAWAAECGISKAVLYCGGQWPDSTGSWQPMTISPLTPILSGATEAGAGVRSSCATTGAGVVCRGDNTLGQLGTNTGAAFFNSYIATRSVPAPVVGLQAGWNHSCVFGGDGLLYCWGDNEMGQAGSSAGGTIYGPSPVLGQGL